MKAPKMPVLHITLLNGTEEQANEALLKVKPALEGEFFLVGSTKPFLFKTQEDLALALESILKILRGDPPETKEEIEEEETNDK